MRPTVRPNALVAAMASGVPARGFHMTVPVPAYIELLGSLGFDLVFLDAEHGSFGLAELEACCRAAELHGLTIVARVPRCDAGDMSRFLDAGVQGIVVPHVDTLAEARVAVASCRYAPRGLRPSGPARAGRFWQGVGDMEAALAAANDNVTLSVQIESVAALDVLPELLALDGIDYFTIGRQDLAQSMGFARLDAGVPDAVTAAAEAATAAIRAAGGRVKDDVMTLCRIDRMLVAGGRQFLSANAEARQ